MDKTFTLRSRYAEPTAPPAGWTCADDAGAMIAGLIYWKVSRPILPYSALLSRSYTTKSACLRWLRVYPRLVIGTMMSGPIACTGLMRSIVYMDYYLKVLSRQLSRRLASIIKMIGSEFVKLQLMLSKSASRFAFMHD